MQFNPTALAAKQRHLDAIVADPDRLTRVARALLSDAPATITPLRRPWEPGGGASLFSVTTASATYFLKVKHLAVTIESKLECEHEFTPEPSLRNEQRQLQRFAGRSFVPIVTRPPGNPIMSLPKERCGPKMRARGARYGWPCFSCNVCRIVSLC